jgi:hypothetical protein
MWWCWWAKPAWASRACCRRWPATQPGLLHASGRPGDHLVPYATIARALRQVLDLDPSAADPALRRALSMVLPELGSGSTLPRQPPVAQPVLALLRNASHAYCRPWRWTTCTLPTTPPWNCCKGCCCAARRCQRAA